MAGAGVGMDEYELTEASASAMPADELEDTPAVDPVLHKRTVVKLDCLLLPFLALLFLFNSLDKANIGNAESAHFTDDIGLEKGAINTAVALFFAFFVTLQPVGAALGRRYGMVLWVPSCMILWGASTALHAWIRHKWQLYTLRIIIGCLEAGFYPVTVTYLSLFYTRFEFGRRLSFFYGQAAIGGALGGLISYLVFSHFGDDQGDVKTKWRPWQVLFLLEGSLTIVVAFAGYFWLPHSAETAWFLTPEERRYASLRVIRDRDMQNASARSQEEEREAGDAIHDDESRGLLSPTKRLTSTVIPARQLVGDRGLHPHDILSAVFNIKIWHILACNVLSAVPNYAFSVFLPLVLGPLTKNANPALINLLTAPPHLCGAITLYLFAKYSDKHRIRLKPVLSGLIIMATGLILAVLLPMSWTIPRYLALNILLSGTYVASPLTVAWISGNTPSPGKRALLLGINGWGNLAGVLSAILFRPKYADSGYTVPFWWTLVCVTFAALGYVLFLRRLNLENKSRDTILRKWSEADIELERSQGRGPLPRQTQWLERVIYLAKRSSRLAWFSRWLEEAARSGREGDEKMTFVFGL
ncbi:MFS general substrate transporter [Decorospora gaudefroyi]|uniref:MFS general substrate transporter n=1 Tax=Decorospora gaudefroyi TaxID=184978 RepID=A0A6A5KK29_9PLEO|nr:MFS general substrate transporter [Decorospora gaudefroyi]